MKLIDFIVIALTVWRISSLVVDEAGPFDIFSIVREKVGDYTEVLECIWCTSLWISFLLCGIYWYIDSVLIFIPFAISTIAIYINRTIDG